MGPTQTMWLSLLESEHPNLRMALDWYIAQGDATSALRQAGALWPFWFFHNHFQEGVSWMARALTLPGRSEDSAGIRGVALLGGGILASVLGDFDRASAWHQEGFALAQEAGDPIGQARSLFGIGGVARHRGDDVVAIAALGDALALFRSTGDLSWMASTLNGLGNVAHRMGDLVGRPRMGRRRWPSPPPRGRIGAPRRHSGLLRRSLMTGATWKWPPNSGRRAWRCTPRFGTSAR